MSQDSETLTRREFSHRMAGSTLALGGSRFSRLVVASTDPWEPRVRFNRPRGTAMLTGPEFSTTGSEPSSVMRPWPPAVTTPSPGA